MKRLTSFLLLLALCATLFLPILPAYAAEDMSQVTQTLRALEIMVGDKDGNLELERSVTRAEFAALLVRASAYKDSLSGQGSGYSLFTDVKSNHWASEAIKVCLDNGWMTGYTDGSFGANRGISLEEACTALLKALGYDTAALAGSFPTAQLNKAAAVGLQDGVTAVRGQRLTRRECAQLFYNLLGCETAQGQVYAATLGYTLAGDEVDYLAVIKENAAGPFLCAGTAPALDFTPTAVYIDDAPSSLSRVTWSRDTLYYTNAAMGYLWVYTGQVFGKITALSPSASSPTAVLVDNKSYPLGTHAVKAKLSALGSGAQGSIVTLLLGMDGEVADARVVAGPFVSNGAADLSFAPETVYRDGVLSSSAALARNDIYYTCSNSNTLWIYTQRITGKVDGLTPNVISPSAITVDGVSYTLGSDALSRELSSLNGKWTDKLVTLLFGMDGTVAHVLTDTAVEDSYVGVVQSTTRQADGGQVETRVTLLCTDGREHTFSANTSTSYAKGNLVQAVIRQGAVSLKKLSTQVLSGTVNRSATKLGGLTFASGIEVLDTDGAAAVAVDVSLLAGLTLDGKVRYYELDTHGDISRLILDNATGETWNYGYLISASTQSSDAMSSTSTYRYLLNGSERSVTTNNIGYSVTGGQGVAIRFDGSSIQSMKNLASVKLTGLSYTTAQANGKSVVLAEDVQIYLVSDGAYYPVERTDISAANYTLTGYYDTTGAQLKVILARRNAA